MPPPSAATFLVKTKLKGHQKRITGFSFSNALNVLVVFRSRLSGKVLLGRVASEIKHVKPRLTSRVSVAQEKRDMISEASKGSGTKPRVRVNDIPVRSKAEKMTPEEAELEEEERSDEESEKESGEEVEAEGGIKISKSLSNIINTTLVKLHKCLNLQSLSSLALASRIAHNLRLWVSHSHELLSAAMWVSHSHELLSAATTIIDCYCFIPTPVAPSVMSKSIGLRDSAARGCRIKLTLKAAIHFKLYGVPLAITQYEALGH
ncbi:Uncharacterized protein Fot_37617 [Forsythia ovata]|uniref:Uncharacterized protein n=1 Tax=Forsythia ovata TaxID=205694 RepID=A0ABD1RZI9_9LAMI